MARQRAAFQHSSPARGGHRHHRIPQTFGSLDPERLPECGDIRAAKLIHRTRLARAANAYRHCTEPPRNAIERFRPDRSATVADTQDEAGRRKPVEAEQNTAVTR